MSSRANNSVQQSRRRLLAALSAGAAVTKLPDLWQQPNVASVMLPAHAASTVKPCSTEWYQSISGSFGTYEITLVATASNLPNDTVIECAFTFPGGSFSPSADALGNGVRACTMSTTVFTQVCGEDVSINFYESGNPGNVICSDTIVATCSLLTWTATNITVIDTIVGP